MLRAVALASAVAILACGVPVRAAPSVPTCVTAPGVNTRCEEWSRWLNDNAKYTHTINDRPAGMVVSPTGNRAFTATTASADGNPTRQSVQAVSLTTGATLWVAHPPTSLPTTSTDIGISPDGSIVAVTGTIEYRPRLDEPSLVRILTVAYSAATGRVLWSSVYSSGSTVVRPVAIASSPHGDRLFVLGYTGYGGTQVYVTISHALKTGRVQWDATYSGVAGGFNQPLALAVAPSGRYVYVTGSTEHPTTSPTRIFDFGTISYDARSGRRVWVQRLRAGEQNYPTGIAISRSGDRVVVTGVTKVGTGTNGTFSYYTVAYRAGNGRQLWAARLDSEVGSAAATAVRVAGSRVIVTGTTRKGVYVTGDSATTSVAQFTTVAYSLANGHESWRSSYSPDAAHHAFAGALAVDASGGRVYVAGSIGQASGAPALYLATVAYDASGATSWTARWDAREPDGPGAVVAVDAAVSHSGGLVVSASAGSAVKSQLGAVGCLVGTDCRTATNSDALVAYAR